MRRTSSRTSSPASRQTSASCAARTFSRAWQNSCASSWGLRTSTGRFAGNIFVVLLQRAATKRDVEAWAEQFVISKVAKHVFQAER